MLVTASRARGARRRRDRRPDLAPRAPAGDGAGRRHDRGQGRGADGGDAHLRARPALDHRRPGRVHDGVRCATRRSPAHLAQKVVEQARRGGRAVSARRRLATLAGPDGPLRVDIRTEPARTSPCDVCGRTLLRGERAEPYLRRRRAPPGVRAVHGARRSTRAGSASRAPTSSALRSARPSGRGPLRRPPARAAASAAARGGRRARPRQEARRAGHALRQRAAARARAEPSPPRAAARARATCARCPTNAELKMERALELFNASEHPRTVGRGGPLARAARPSPCARSAERRAWWRSSSRGS